MHSANTRLPPSRWSVVAGKAFSGLCILIFLYSLLAVFQAPTILFWIPAIIATEWGHDLAVVCGVLFFIPGAFVRRPKSRGLLAVSACLFISPLLRALPVAHRLPSELSTAFGPLTQPLRPSPIRFTELFAGLTLPQPTPRTLVYSSPGGVALHVDVYASSAPGLRPLILIVHGGSWKSGSRDELQRMDFALAARGYVVASIDYRLAPKAIFPAQREDTLQALSYLHAHAADVGWNNRQLVILGRSAGGQIALSAAYAAKDPTIKGAIAFYTPSDMVYGYSIPGNPWIMNSRLVMSTYLGGSLGNRPNVYRDASPVDAVTSVTPPTLMIHGGRDELVWPVHDLHLSGALAAAHRPHYFLFLPWATHACDANLSGPSGQLSLYAMDYFLKTVFKA